ncbi:MAG TPA: hypothetical protein VJN93_15345 [Candidatus Acidoferrum sp.]|nr:hypothetical protein [Candidatus Acidoferrum sp.]
MSPVFKSHYTPASILRFFAACIAAPLLVVALLTWQASPIQAQDSSSSSGQVSSQSGAKPAGRSTVLTTPDQNGPDVTQQTPDSGVQQLGRGGWLGSTTSPLHWGSFYIDSLEFDQGYDQFDGLPTTSPGIFRTSLFQTTLVYDLQLERSRFAFQWLPEVGLINGQFANNLNNEHASIDYTRLITPRLSIHFQNQVQYGTVRNLFFDSYLYAAETPGNTSVQNGFLDGAGTRLVDDATLSFDYRLSPRATLALTPGFNYAEQYGSNSFYVGSKEFIGTAHLTYQTNRRITIGAMYTADAVKFSNTPGLVLYHTIGGTFSDQLSRTVNFSSTFGLSRATLSSNSVYWSFYGDAEISKSFRRSALALAYSRGLNLAQTNSQFFTDRVDLTYSVQLSRKINASMGGGYQRAGGNPTFSGEYGTGQIGYNFLPSLGILATYTYRNQVGDNTQVFTETRNTAYLTLRWQPPRPQ